METRVSETKNKFIPAAEDPVIGTDQRLIPAREDQGMYAVFLKSASFVSFTDKNFKCLTEIKILSVQMSDTKIQDVLHRIRTCLTENYPVWHDVSFCQTECLTS